MPRGILGFKRLFSTGPFTFSQEAENPEEIENLLIDIVEEEDINTEDLDLEQFRTLKIELVNRMYPDGGNIIETPAGTINEQQLFATCLESQWADLWSNGFTRTTTEVDSIYEELIMKANGCKGIANAGNRGLRVLAITNLDDLNPLFG